MRQRWLSESQVERDYFRSQIEQHRVSDITINAFYQSRTLTVLACIWLTLAYIACARSNTYSIESNLFHGFIAVFIIFLCISTMIMPNGPFTRPHPVVWRIVFGASLFYFLCLVCTTFLSLEQARQMVVWVYPSLKGMSRNEILDKEYAVNCSEVTLERLYSHLDIFAVAHFFGWMVKAILLRDPVMSWMLSINWEVTELAFSHILPNFNECWWDSLILDILLCNGLGIQVGIWLCRWLEMRDYHWVSIRDLPGTKEKLKRAVLQFTPQSWVPTQWLHGDSSILRSYLLSQLIVFWQFAELNSFFLKHIFIVKPSHVLTQLRLLLITLMSAPGIRQYYLYVIDPHVKRVGSQLWLFLAVILTETLVCFKLGSETFEETIMWNLFYWLIWMVFSTFLTVWFCRYLARIRSGQTRTTTSSAVERTMKPATNLNGSLKDQQNTSLKQQFLTDDSSSFPARRRVSSHDLIHTSHARNNQIKML